MDKKQILLSTLKTASRFNLMLIAVLGILVGLPVIYFSGSWFMQYGSNLSERNPAVVIFFGLLLVLSSAFFITVPLLVIKNTKWMKELIDKYLLSVESLKLELDPSQLWYEQTAPFTVTKFVLPLSLGLSKIQQNQKELKIFHTYDNDRQHRLMNGGTLSTDYGRPTTCFEIPAESKNRFMIFPKKAKQHSSYSSGDEKRMAEFNENYMIIYYLKDLTDTSEEIDPKTFTESVKKELGEKFMKDLNELPGLNSILFTPTYVRLNHQDFVVDKDELKKYMNFILTIN